MAGRKSDFTLPTNTLDELFSTQEERDDAKLSKIRDIPLELIDDFPDHPFKVRDDEDMIQLVESVKERGVITPATQNVDDLLQSHTARTMLANSEFIIMLNQASTDRIELAKLLNISDTQLSYITNVDAGHGLIKVGSSLVPFANKFPKNTKLYKLMTTKLSDIAN